MENPEDNKSEFDWEQSFRQNDEFARHYFHLLRRYGDLPDGEDLITSKLVKIFGEEFVDEMYSYDDYFSDFDLPPLDGAGMDMGEDGDDDELKDEEGADAADAAKGGDEPPPFTDDQLAEMSETRPGLERIDRRCHELIVSLTQTAMGWCNLYSCLLTKEHRSDGLRVMFFVSRALANISVSLEEMIRWEVNTAVARGKRCLDNVNQAIGLVNELKENCPALREVMTAMQTHLIKNADELSEYIRECRELGVDDTPF